MVTDLAAVANSTAFAEVVRLTAVVVVEFAVGPMEAVAESANCSVEFSTTEAVVVVVVVVIVAALGIGFVVGVGTDAAE